MQTRYAEAVQRPLGTQSEPVIGKPRILVFHTMVGYLSSTDAMFHKDGYRGTESHFGIGGIWGSDLKPDPERPCLGWKDLPMAGHGLPG